MSDKSKGLDFQTYLISLLESNYLAGMQQGLSMQLRMHKEKLKTSKYDVQANAEIPKIKADLKTVGAILRGHNNIINNYLQEAYGFKFEYIRLEPLPEPTVEPNPETVMKAASKDPLV